MDKFSDFFRATIAVFHGIISTWLFVEFSESSVDQFQFLILLVFFSVANILVWNLTILIFYRIRQIPASVALVTNDITALRYRAMDVIGLTFVAIVIGLAAAYVQRQDAALWAANHVANWRRTHSDAPFNLLLLNVSGRSMGNLDSRDPLTVKAAGGQAYLRVYQKDLKLAYEGYPAAAASKRDAREVILSPACRVTFGENDASKTTGTEIVEGPGVFVRLADVGAIEIIDQHKSRCAELFHELEKKMKAAKPAP